MKSPDLAATDEEVRSRPRWYLLVIVGLIGGLLSGAFGVGGGIVMVPLLLLLVRMDEREASITSLSAVLPASVVGSIAYLLHGEVDLFAALALIIGSVPGALFGAWLVRRLPVTVLRWLFIALLVGIAVRTLLVVQERGAGHTMTLSLFLLLIVVGVLVGVASGLFGVGGGIIIVPVLSSVLGFSDLVAKGTSLVVMIASSGVGTVSHARNRAINWRTTGLVAVSAIAASYLGVLLALAMSPRVSSILFGVLLLAAAAQLVVRALRKRREPLPES